VDTTVQLLCFCTQEFESEFHTAVTVKITVFWDVTPCSLADVIDVSKENVEEAELAKFLPISLHSKPDIFKGHNLSPCSYYIC
jgi:hypothetical protein